VRGLPTAPHPERNKVSEHYDVHEETIRQKILENPEKLLSDTDVVRALVGASERGSDRKVVDLRSAMVNRLEQRLDVLQDTHRDVVSAAYENLAGTNQIHRAVLSLIKPQSFEGFLDALQNELFGIIAADGMHLCVEGEGMQAGEPIGPDGPLRQTVLGLPVGGVDAYFGARNSMRSVLLRPVPASASLLYGRLAEKLRSEAVLRINLGDGSNNGMLVVGSMDNARFHAGQATDLMEFLGGALECTVRRWLT